MRVGRRLAMHPPMTSPDTYGAFPPLPVSGPPEDSELARSNFSVRERVSRSWFARLSLKRVLGVTPLQRRSITLSSSPENNSFSNASSPTSSHINIANDVQAGSSSVPGPGFLQSGPSTETKLPEGAVASAPVLECAAASQDSGRIILKNTDDYDPLKSEQLYRWAMVYENQRGLSLFSTPRYSSQSLLPKDPPPFSVASPLADGGPASNPKHRQANVSLVDYPLPDGNWQWASSEWMIDMRDGNVQHDGFEYNWIFRRNKWHSKGGRLNAGAWVRRRRWVRLMERPPLSALRHNEEHGSTTDTIEVPHSMEIGTVWQGDEDDWIRLHRVMQLLGRDGRKLEAWKEWLGIGVEDRDKSDKFPEGTQKQPEGKWLAERPKLEYIAAVLRDHFPLRHLQVLQNDHPLRVAARTYALSLSLSLGPALIPIITGVGINEKKYARLLYTLRRELGASGFAFAMTMAVGGGTAMEYYWRRFMEGDGQPESPRTSNDAEKNEHSLLKKIGFSSVHRAFLCYTVTSLLAIALMQSRRRSSHRNKANMPRIIPIYPPGRTPDKRMSGTLDLTFLLLVRALDSVVQGVIQYRAKVQTKNVQSNKEVFEDTGENVQKPRKRATIMTDKFDAVAFWAASARIMWCFFYRPERLPRSYVKWIGTLANVDDRILDVLRRRREGTWTYGEEPSHGLLSPMAEDLGYSPSWGDTLQLPSIGGETANKTWELLGVKGRTGVGGLPCELIHGGVGRYIIPGGVGSSCFANLLVRSSMGFLEALAIYAPVHLVPIILSRPDKLLSFSELRKTVSSLLQSSLFLSAFISSIWTTISHNFFDGPFGCVPVGCLACGGSIWIEQGKRRGEMALYVLPRALRSLLSNAWLRSGSRSLKLMERLAFVLSLASILTASRYRPETLRGLSRWTVMFVLRGTRGDAQNSKTT
ncbi:hypothetical protein EW145_g875 [Phellinidium pouzarii]|uniref:TECPR1-like DysF domain-containing protein n=1 Tax=Phellinidium pouzarii TaxID=167371 RepID=A0A4S4LM69_9AGAM|nr:hypothetical protein EW145_g875 [Phellinidium pouzarii]